jgi:hypothetical protein
VHSANRPVAAENALDMDTVCRLGVEFSKNNDKSVEADLSRIQQGMDASHTSPRLLESAGLRISVAEHGAMFVGSCAGAIIDGRQCSRGHAGVPANPADTTAVECSKLDRPEARRSR